MFVFRNLYLSLLNMKQRFLGTFYNTNKQNYKQNNIRNLSSFSQDLKQKI